MIGQTGQMLMALTDTLVVGRLGVTALAAIAFANSVVSMLFFGLGILASISIIGAQAHGAGLVEQRRNLLGTSLWLSLGLGSALALLVCVSFPFLPVLAQPKAVLEAGRPFLIIVAWSLVPGLGYTAAILNFALNVALFFGLLGAPKLGLPGSAYATLLSRSFAMFGTLFYALRIAGIRVSHLSPGLLDGRLLQALLTMGIPVGLQYLAEVAAFSFSAVMVGWIGPGALAAHQIAIICAATTFMFPLGISQAVTIRIGHALGAGQQPLMRTIGCGGLAAAAGVMGCSAVVFGLWNQQIPQLFSTDHEVITIASLLVLVAGVFQLADGVQVTAAGALRGMADVRIPMWISGGYWGVAIPLAYLGGFIMGFGALGVWCGLASGLFVAATVFTVRKTLPTSCTGSNQVAKQQVFGLRQAPAHLFPAPTRDDVQRSGPTLKAQRLFGVQSGATGFPASLWSRPSGALAARSSSTFRRRFRQLPDGNAS